MIFRVIYQNLHTIRHDMNTQFEIFFIISFLAAFLMFGLAAYVSRFRNIQSVNVFMILLITIGIWTFSIGVGYISNSESISYFWSIIRMAAFFWYLFCGSFLQCSIANLKMESPKDY